jgi:MATE family multidrug resistance protein
MRGLAGELRPTLRLAGPVVLAELGWTAMGIADTIMVGALGPEAIGAVGLGNILYFTVVIVGYGLLLGLDTLVSQAYGAGNVEDCHRSLVHGTYLALVLTPILMVFVALGARPLGSWGVHPDVVREARPYLWALNWGTLPLLIFTAVRRYLQSMDVVGVVMFALISANVVNVAGNWVLVYGHLGFAPLGVVGSGWATCLARLWMAAVLVVYAAWHAHRYRTGLWRVPLGIEWARVRRLVALGGPVAIQIMLEIAVFAFAAMLAGRLGPTSLAAHEIVLHAAGTTFMVPLGVSSAAAVRVGQALGRGDRAGAARAGWTSLLLGAAFMACAAVTFLTVPRSILGLVSADRAVIALGVPLMFSAALFQLFDGTQVVASGALRGAGDTRTPMYCTLAAHWALGLPVAYLLAFPGGWGVFGLWVGLSSGLIAAGTCLLTAWAMKARTLTRPARLRVVGGPPRRQADRAIPEPVGE